MGETGARLAKYIMVVLFIVLIVLDWWWLVFRDRFSIAGTGMALGFPMFLCARCWEAVQHKRMAFLLSVLTFAEVVLFEFAAYDWLYGRSALARALAILLLFAPSAVLYKFAWSDAKKARIAAEAARLERNRLYRQKDGVWGGRQQ